MDGAERYADLMRQGFMKTLRTPKAKAFDERAWAKRCAKASRKAYARMWGDNWADEA